MLVHQIYGIENVDICRSPDFSYNNLNKNRNLLLDRIIQFENEFERCVIEENENNALFVGFTTFAKNHRTRTTNRVERSQRVKFLSDYITGIYDGE